MAHRILLVDDEPAALTLFSSLLDGRYAIDTARSAELALNLVRSEKPYAVVVADVFLPGMSGIELLAQLAKLSPDTVRIALTGDPGRETVVESVNYGNVHRFVSKPIRAQAFVEMVDEAVQRFEAQLCEREMMETTVRTSVNLLLEVLATLNPASFELSQRLQGSVRLFARGQKLPNSWELELAAALSRIGLVALPGPISRKVAHDLPLTAREAEIVASIPKMGANLLKQIARMDRVAQAIRYQAKNYDGSGTPADDLARTDIPLGGRVLRVFIDRALLEQDGIAGAEAQARLSARRGVYDPDLLAASFRQFPEYILSTISADRRIRLVDSGELRPGLLLVTEIRTAERLLLVASGTRLTPLMVQRIQTHVALGTVIGPFGVQEPPAEEEAAFEPDLRAAV